MKPIQVTPREAEMLDALCELGQTDLVAYRLGIKIKTVTHCVNQVAKRNGHPTRLTLALAWDREKRATTGENT